jgi:hypothetical protein
MCEMGRDEEGARDWPGDMPPELPASEPALDLPLEALREGLFDPARSWVAEAGGVDTSESSTSLSALSSLPLFKLEDKGVAGVLPRLKGADLRFRAASLTERSSLVDVLSKLPVPRPELL